jgi:ribosomal protein S18 acetylase RimI-like enzyme
MCHKKTNSITVLRAGSQHAYFARQALYEMHERSLPDEEALVRFLENEFCYLFIAIFDEEVVGSLNGYALLQPERQQLQFLLYEIDVKETWQGQGIGTRLVNAFVAAACKVDAFEVWVLTNQSNAAAMALYRKCGFERDNPDDVMFSITL